MNLEWLLLSLQCPACRSPFASPSGESLQCHGGHSFPLIDGMPCFVSQAELAGTDRDYQPKYDHQAVDYDEQDQKLCDAFQTDARELRRSFVDRLQLGAGANVLDVASGTGGNFAALLETVDERSHVVGIDLSVEMSRVARQKFAGDDRVDLILGNASRLPFADDTFDGLLSVGGVNTFSDISAALAEASRVVRVGGRVVFVDEGLAPWMRETPVATSLRAFSSLYEHMPPIKLLPTTADEVSVEWIMCNAYWAMTFRICREYAAPDLSVFGITS